MKNFFTFLLILCIANISFGQIQAPKDPYLKTFIINKQQQPNLQTQNLLRDKPQWKNFTNANGAWWVQFNEISDMPQRATGKGIETSGSTIEERTMNFIQTQLNGYVPASVNLRLTSTNTSKYIYVDYMQTYMGLDVLFSNLKLRMTKDDYKMILFGIDVYPDITVNTTPSFNSDQAANYASSDFTITVTSTEVSPQLKILPTPNTDAGGYKYHLVYEVVVKTLDAQNIPGAYRTYLDANNGEILYRINEVKACGKYFLDGADVTTNADVSYNPYLPLVKEGLPYIRVQVGSDYYYADENGILNLPSITTPTAATVDLRGLYAKVSEGSGDTNIESVDITLNPGDNLISFDVLSGSTLSEVSAYYHQNKIHDYMKSRWPGFTSLDVPQLIHVERNDGSCNAYYDGTSTNFYAEGGGCFATALFDDVVMHEYGHGINYELYAWLGAGGLSNGAMQEAYADLWGIGVTENPIMGSGFFMDPSSFIRRYDLAPKVYPEDITGEVHADGEIIAGAWWDYAENIDSVQGMFDLWTETWYAVPDGPSGTEGQIYGEILIDALIADDDNADLSDGTPNDDEIISAFEEHGINLLNAINIVHNEPLSVEEAIEPVPIDVTIGITFPFLFGEFNMYYRTSPTSTWETAPLTLISGDEYESEIPPQPAGTVVEYYFKATDLEGNTIYEPYKVNLTDPALPHFLIIGAEQKLIEDFDNTFGDWVINPIGDDDATTGNWEIAEPVAAYDAYGYLNQPGTDNTPGTSNICAVTGNDAASALASNNDVDGGKTSLRSPIFDLSSYSDPIISYYRWFSNDCPQSDNPGNDPLQVFISNDNSNWIKIERTFTSDNRWRRNVLKVKDYVELTSTISLLFVAQDSVIPPLSNDGGSIVDAAIDDLAIYDVPADTTIDTSTFVIDEMPLNMSIYPNPVSDQLNIVLANQQTADVEMNLFNAVGESVWNKKLTAPYQNKYVVNCKDFSSGVYTLTVQTGNNTERRKIVISN